MKLRSFLVFTIFTTVLLLSSCTVNPPDSNNVPSHDFNVEIYCDEFGFYNNLSGDFEVEVGDKIRVELCSNPTTGFQWGYEITKGKMSPMKGKPGYQPMDLR